MTEIKSDGMAIRLVKEWVTLDPNPHAFSLLVCPDCLQQIIGAGVTLTESMATAHEVMAAHKCSHLAVASPQGDGAGE